MNCDFNTNLREHTGCEFSSSAQPKTLQVTSIHLNQQIQFHCLIPRPINQIFSSYKQLQAPLPSSQSRKSSLQLPTTSPTIMASLLLRPLLRPQMLGLGLGLSLATYHNVTQQPLLLDSRSPSPSILPGDSCRRNAATPVVRNGNLNPGAVRQISSGSIIGGLLFICF